MRQRQVPPADAIEATGCSNVHVVTDRGGNDTGLAADVSYKYNIAGTMEAIFSAYLDGQLVGSFVPPGGPERGIDASVSWNDESNPPLSSVPPGEYTFGVAVTPNYPGATAPSTPQVECGPVSVKQDNGGGGGGNGNGSKNGDGELPLGLSRRDAALGVVAVGSFGWVAWRNL